jgi:hypothetical protein
LLEVVFSLAIFFISFIAICQVVNLGSDWAMEAQFNQRAALLCQSKLDEFASGMLPMQSVPESMVEEEPEWVWSATCAQDMDIPGLWRVQVMVGRERNFGKRIEVSVSQLIIDPALRGSTFDQPPTGPATVPEPATEEGTDMGTTGSTSGTGGTTTGGN